MIAIIDYGMGNLRSMQKAVESLDFRAVVTDEKSRIKKAKKVIFPGVGAFGAAAENLKKLKLFNFIKDIIISGIPFLGVCLGLQLLFEKSEESPSIDGLGVFKGKVIKFRGRSLKIPHMGWNTINVVRSPSSVVRSKSLVTSHESRVADRDILFREIHDKSYMYFVHSYCVVPVDKAIIAAKTNYGDDFVSAVVKDKIFGVQFHPEKSAANGLKILKNFLEF